MKILVTGWAGFIGSNLIRKLLQSCSEEDEIMGLDAYTYAARPEWVLEMENPKPKFHKMRIDLNWHRELEYVVKEFQPDKVYHLAAESHVCRSIEGPRAFAETNFMGTFNLLEALRKSNFKGKIVHVSTDETFGQLKEFDPPFHEKTLIEPTSPYAASKAASDLMVNAYVHTYGFNACITRCTNNYGPNQHEEKLIPKAIMSFLSGKPMTLYGPGNQVREWIHVDDHNDALISVMRDGRTGEIYCIGSGLELSNKEVIEFVAKVINTKHEIIHTNDRPTDDFRYAVNTDKIKTTGWEPCASTSYFLNKLAATVEWYKEHGK